MILLRFIPTVKIFKAINYILRVVEAQALSDSVWTLHVQVLTVHGLILRGQSTVQTDFVWSNGLAGLFFLFSSINSLIF